MGVIPVRHQCIRKSMHKEMYTMSQASKEYLILQFTIQISVRRPFVSMMCITCASQ